MNELKPEDVMRALEYLVECTDSGLCNNSCPQHRNTYCRYYILKATLALLRENDALIAALINNNADLEMELAKTYDMLDDTARAEAITEFAEKGKRELRSGNAIMDKSIADIIDQIAKEMKGETQ